MSEQKAIFGIEIKELRNDGGTIVISTGTPDRSRDRVMPRGGDTANYLKNPVVLWAHNYRDPWATIGKTNTITVSNDAIEADFTFRSPANDADPVVIIRDLWENKFINTASVGFRPDWEFTVENDDGGMNFMKWELLEWSLVPVPDNPEAVRRIFKSYPEAGAILYSGSADFMLGASKSNRPHSRAVPTGYVELYKEVDTLRRHVEELTITLNAIQREAEIKRRVMELASLVKG